MKKYLTVQNLPMIFFGTFILALTIFTVVISNLDAETEDEARQEFAIEVEDARTVAVNIHVPAGDVLVASGAEALFEGEFEYPNSDWSTNVDYAIAGDMGSLTIEQRTNSGIPLHAHEHVFDLLFNEEIPLSLTMQRRLGHTELLLEDLHLNAVEAHLGDGNDQIELGGTHEPLTTLTLSSGYGIDVVDMNCDCPALTSATFSLGGDDDRVMFDGTFAALTVLDLNAGLGDDLVTLNGAYTVLTTMALDLGAGDDSLTLGGVFPALQTGLINVGAGEDVIDLGENWDRDTHLIVLSQGDTTTLRLPDTIGVAVQLSGPTPQVTTTNVKYEDDIYTNDVYGDAEVTLHITLHTSTIETVVLRVE